MINLELAKQKGLSEERVTAIKELHKQADAVLRRPHHYGEVDEESVTALAQHRLETGYYDDLDF